MPPTAIIVCRHNPVRQPNRSGPSCPADRREGPHGLQKVTGYRRRSLVETAIGRHKHIIGPTLRAHSDTGQTGEAAISVDVFNRTIRIAKPDNALTIGMKQAHHHARRKQDAVSWNRVALPAAIRPVVFRRIDTGPRQSRIRRSSPWLLRC